MVDLPTLAASLSEAQRRTWSHLTLRQQAVFILWPHTWASASDVLGLRIAGNTASVLADKGLFERRSDPNVWGRSQYRVAEQHAPMRAFLEGEGR